MEIMLIDSLEFEIEFESCLKMFFVNITQELARKWLPQNFQPIEKTDGIIYFKEHSSITNCKFAYKLKWKHALLKFLQITQQILYRKTEFSLQSNNVTKICCTSTYCLEKTCPLEYAVKNTFLKFSVEFMLAAGIVGLFHTRLHLGNIYYAEGFFRDNHDRTQPSLLSFHH